MVVFNSFSAHGVLMYVKLWMLMSMDFVTYQGKSDITRWGDIKNLGDQTESLNQSLVMIGQFKETWVSYLQMASGHIEPWLRASFSHSLHSVTALRLNGPRCGGAKGYAVVSWVAPGRRRFEMIRAHAWEDWICGAWNSLCSRRWW